MVSKNHDWGDYLYTLWDTVTALLDYNLILLKGQNTGFTGNNKLLQFLIENICCFDVLSLPNNNISSLKTNCKIFRRKNFVCIELVYLYWLPVHSDGNLLVGLTLSNNENHVYSRTGKNASEWYSELLKYVLSY